ncbi:unnamed protein product [Peronospora belbahrii]|uniref:Uncharacterized protein n=1 Tax=Peronospora belbahrii TaxID=622444 RepID=A0AAU9L9D4_9STRA|nr:unnamed protein product [Peronospora belbahrii]CAH0522458.1 unnamed protein product [Peronospora belbahrii]
MSLPNRKTETGDVTAHLLLILLHRCLLDLTVCFKLKESKDNVAFGTHRVNMGVTVTFSKSVNTTSMLRIAVVTLHMIYCSNGSINASDHCKLEITSLASTHLSISYPHCNIY